MIHFVLTLLRIEEVVEMHRMLETHAHLKAAIHKDWNKQPHRVGGSGYSVIKVIVFYLGDRLHQ